MATRGRKPLPSHLRVVKGGRSRVKGVIPADAEGPGDPPSTWSPEQKALWHEIVEAAPAGVLAPSDRLLIELAARNLANLRSAGGELTAAQSAEMRRCLGEMGMTPSERARLAVPTESHRNPFLDL